MYYAIYNFIPLVVYVFTNEADRDQWLTEDIDREAITHENAAARTFGEIDEMPYDLMTEIDGIRVCGDW